MTVHEILEKYEILESGDDGFPSCLIVDQDHAVICLRQYSISGDGLEESLVFFLIQGDIVTKVHFETESKYTETKVESLWDALDDVLTANHNVLDTISEEAEELEDSVFDRKIPRNSIDLWFQMRGAVSKIKRSFGRVGVIFSQMKKSEFFKPRLNEEYNSLVEYTGYGERECVSTMQKLESLHHYLASVKADKLNANIYLLALVSGVFLPLNLMVGFFGMNTKGMFLDQYEDGTLLVLQSLGVLFFILILGLPLLRVLDAIIFRRIFAFSRIYKRMSKRLEDLNESFSIKMQ